MLIGFGNLSYRPIYIGVPIHWSSSRHKTSFYLTVNIFLLLMDSSACYVALCLMTTIPVFFMKWPFVQNLCNPNGLLSRKVCRYLDQGPTLNDNNNGWTFNGLL